MRNGIFTAALAIGAAIGGNASAAVHDWHDDCLANESLDACRQRLGVPIPKEDVGDKANRLGDQARENAKDLGGEAKSGMQELGESIRGGDEFGRIGKAQKPLQNQVVIDPIGMATGDGLNAQFGRPLGGEWRKWEPVAYARYSQTSIVGGDIGRLGLNVGMDYFVFGSNGEGARVGPRVGLIGAYDNRGTNTYSVGGLLGGEAGYTFVATNGVTAAGGLGLEFSGAGNFGGNSGWDGNSNPYGRIQVGYSW